MTLNNTDRTKIPWLLILVSALACFPAMANGPRQLFNGNDLSGWQHIGFGSFEVENGLLHAKGGIGILVYTAEKIGDAKLRVVYKVDSPADNSGIFIRIPELPDDPWMPIDRGLEVQINEAGKSEYHRTGSIYTFSKAMKNPAKIGEWNLVEIKLMGSTTEVSINGDLVSRYAEGDEIPTRVKGDPAEGPRPEKGYIGLQNHPQGKGVYFREVSIESLDE